MPDLPKKDGQQQHKQRAAAAAIIVVGVVEWLVGEGWGEAQPREIGLGAKSSLHDQVEKIIIRKGVVKLDNPVIGVIDF